jgi:hypothetical protein
MPCNGHLGPRQCTGRLVVGYGVSGWNLSREAANVIECVKKWRAIAETDSDEEEGGSGETGVIVDGTRGSHSSRF